MTVLNRRETRALRTRESRDAIREGTPLRTPHESLRIAVKPVERLLNNTERLVLRIREILLNEGYVITTLYKQEPTHEEAMLAHEMQRARLRGNMNHAAERYEAETGEVINNRFLDFVVDALVSRNWKQK